MIPRVLKLKAITGLFFIVFLCLSVLSCSKQDTTQPASLVNQTESETSARVKAGNFAPGQLVTHYLKHAYQFGDFTQEEYLLLAQELLNAAPSKEVLEKIRPNGDILHYRVSTGEFAVMTSYGRIRTYFKTNQAYWQKQ